MDILYGKLCQNKELTTSFTEFTESLQIMYEIARRKMKCPQNTYATYYDKKAWIVPCKKVTVYVYLPRNRRKKLTKKWKGPYKIVEANHPVYHVEV